MSAFDLDERGADEIDAKAATEGVPFMPGAPSIFQGTPTATVKGLARGTVGKTAVLLGDAITPVLKPTAKAIDQTVGTSLDKWLDDQQRLTRQSLEDLKPDPHTTGFAAQVLGGFADIGSSAVLFTPEGAAILEGYARKQELEGQGVGPNVAAAGGAVSGVATLVGVKAPMTLGRVAAGQGAASVVKNMGFGAAANVSAGVAERGTLRELLERSGFHDQARIFEPYDQQTMLAEGAIGALFSGSAAALELRGTQQGQQTIDAALAAKAAKHHAVETAPGVPADTRSSAAHARAMGTAIAQALRNEPVRVGEALADTTFVRTSNDSRHAALDELQLHVADLLHVPAFSIPADAPRGIRANNPGNIKATGEQWQGQVGSDGGFVTFGTPQAGIRAMAKTLLTYQDVHGLNTVEGIIGRWAPPGENNTPAYVLAVARVMGIEPTARLDVHDQATMRGLVQAIVRHENGLQPYPEALIRGGVDDALSGRVPGAPAADLPVSRPGGGAEGPAGRSGDIRVAGESADAGAVPQELRAELESKLGKFEASVLQSGSEVPRAMSDAGGAGQAAPVEFITAKGSVYQVHDDGTTTRNKAARLDAGHEGDAGPKERTVRTVYVDADASALSAAGLSNLGPHGARVVINEGKASLLTWNEKAGRWGASASARDIPVHDQPAVGRHPLELWGPANDVPGRQAFSRMHAGNRITEIQRSRVNQAATHGGSPQGSAQPAGGRGGSSPARGAEPAAVAAGTSDAAAPAPRAADPAVTAAAEVAALRPDMLVAMEDGTELPASEVLARAEAERVQAEQDARAFQAAAHCFLRS